MSKTAYRLMRQIALVTKYPYEYCIKDVGLSQSQVEYAQQPSLGIEWSLVHYPKGSVLRE